MRFGFSSFVEDLGRLRNIDRQQKESREEADVIFYPEGLLLQAD